MTDDLKNFIENNLTDPERDDISPLLIQGKKVYFFFLYFGEKSEQSAVWYQLSPDFKTACKQLAIDLEKVDYHFQSVYTSLVPSEQQLIDAEHATYFEGKKVK